MAGTFINTFIHTAEAGPVHVLSGRRKAALERTARMRESSAAQCCPRTNTGVPCCTRPHTCCMHRRRMYTILRSSQRTGFKHTRAGQCLKRLGYPTEHHQNAFAWQVGLKRITGHLLKRMVILWAKNSVIPSSRLLVGLLKI